MYNFLIYHANKPINKQPDRIILQLWSAFTALLDVQLYTTVH